jgi:hypothetical protein
MNAKKVSVSAILLFLFAGFLFSQDLVEVAKREKERRAKLKGLKSTVVTNEILKKRKIEPGISFKHVQPPQVEIIDISDLPKRRSLDSIPSQAPWLEFSSSFIDIKSFEQRWQEAKEQVALLTLQMNALQQKYYSMYDMTPRSHIQQQISDTYLRLQKAQMDAEQAKKDLDEVQKKNQKKRLPKINEGNLKP